MSPVVVFLLYASTIMLALGVLAWLADRNAPQPAPDLEPARDVCDLESCGEPSAVEFVGSRGPLYICAKHAGPVSAWAPVVGVRLPYDQESGVA